MIAITLNIKLPIEHSTNLSNIPTITISEAEIMDGQHDTHGSSYAYADPHWAEFYDLWIATIFDTANKPHEDIAILWSQLSAQLAIPKGKNSGKKFKVIDVGTGTGRVVKSLIKCAVDEGIGLGGLHILGVDHGAAMVERAEKTYGKLAKDEGYERSGVTVLWQTCSATQLIEKNPAFEGETDLIIFAAGGLGHLTAEREVDTFLEEVAKLLGSHGVMIISILNETIAMGGKNAPMREEDAPDSQESMTIRSEENEGLVYRKSGAWQRWDKRGLIRTDGFRIAMLEENRDRNEMKVAKTKDVEWSLRIFEEATWERRVREKGLMIEGVKEGEIQRWYFLKRA